MDLSIGARASGMGNAYVGVAENAEALFVNPAGLGTDTSFKFTSMYTSLLGDLNYVVIAGTYPLDNDWGSIGAGIINESADSIKLYTVGGTYEGNGLYGDNMVFISHGLDLSKKFLPSLPGLYGGYTLKYMMMSADGYQTSGLNGTGLSADLGLLYKPQGAITYGLSLQNILAGSMTYSGAEEDPIGSSAKVGVKVAVLGDALDNASLYSSDSKLDVAADCDMGLTYKIPGTFHVGLEYKPQIGVNYIDNILTLRAGMNQVPTPSGNLSDLTLGIGITYQGMEFNYAYTPSDGDIPESSSQFFSISYVGIPEMKKPVEEKPVASVLPMIAQVQPDDKVITRDKTLLIQGKLNDASRVDKVEINGAGVNVSNTGDFSMNVPLDTTGKHLITIKAYDKTGKSEERTIRAIRLVKFADVPDSHWAVTPVEQLATTGLIEGYPNGTFQPERALSRAELATLLIKSKGVELPTVSGKIFKDMPSTHWAAKYVKEALDLGYVQGYPDKTFKPNNKITRTEGVVVLSRFNAATPESQLRAGPYPDLTAKYWASPLIAAAKTSGLLDYIGDKDFEPRKELTRAEAVVILAKTSYGRAKVDSMFDWTVGFVPETTRPVVAGGQVLPGAIASTVTGKPKLPGKQVPAIKEFSDIGDDFWAAESIKYIATANIMGGYPDNTFRGDRIVTRAELAAILVKAKGISVPKVASTGYSDVPKSNWAASSIKAAVDAGLMTGRKGNKFEPNKGATRAEAVAALVRFDNTALPGDLKAGPFPDMTAREWASKYVAAAKDAGMLGYLQGQDFEPQKSITRAEVADILAKTQFGQAKINEIKSAGNYKSEENL